jgi:hypothetical protein
MKSWVHFFQLLMTYVYLVCIKEGSRKRVRIISDNYIKTANCSFPSAIRVVNQMYRVDENSVKLVGPSKKGKFYYSIKKANITKVDTQPAVARVYNTAECVVCLESTPHYVFVPCGHHCVCLGCYDKLTQSNYTNCVMCRSKIVGVTTVDNIQ